MAKLIEVKDFNIKLFHIDEPTDKDNIKNKHQIISFPVYKYDVFNDPLVFSVRGSIINQYGIPRINEIIKNDAERNYLQLPFNDSNQEVYNMFIKIDEYVKGNSERLLGSKYKSYEYSPIVKSPTSSANKKVLSVTRNYPDFFKGMFDIDQTTHEINTHIFHKSEEGIITKLEIKNMSELEKYIIYGRSKLSMVCTINKFWINKQNNDKKCLYGVTVKLLQVMIETVKIDKILKKYSECIFQQFNE